MKKKSAIKRKLDAFEIIIFTVVGLYVLSMIAVLYLGFLNSLKTYDDSIYYKNFFGLPREEYGGWLWNNYGLELFNSFRVQISGSPKYFYMGDMLIHSIVYAITVSFATIICQIMVAYAVSKYDFKGKNVLYMTAIIVMLIPIVGSLPSQMEVMEALHLKNSFLGVCIMKSSYTGMNFLIFYAGFKNVSSTYMEAAQIDGASHLKIFIQIMVPLLASTIFAVFVLQFIANWNDYYTPMLFVPAKPTIAYGLFEFKAYPEREAATSLKLSASIVSCIPIVIIFIIFRNKIMGNIAIGGIKG